MAKQIKIPYDSIAEIHLPHDDYKMDGEPHNTMEMIESILLGTTIPYDVDDKITRNNLNFVNKTLSTDAKPMAQLLSVIQWLQINETEIANQKFTDVISSYMHGPFLVWSNSRKDGDGLKNYLPAAASTLQTMIFGYAGIRLYLDRLEFGRSRYPLKSTGLSFAGLFYLGNQFGMEIRNGSAIINFKKLSDDTPILIRLADTDAKSEPVQLNTNCKYWE